MPGESKEKADLVLYILRYDMNECICDCYIVVTTLQMNITGVLDTIIIE
jgi:hypothetical protein